MKPKSAPLRYAAILDTETTSLEPPPMGAAIEVAVMLFDLKHAQPVESYASLIRRAHNEAEAINGIPMRMLKEAPEAGDVWRVTAALVKRADVIIAHSAEFDRLFCPDFERPWVCSENDIKWPHQDRPRAGSLPVLALSLGVGVSSAHRALADVDTLARIFTRLAELGPLEPLLRHAMRPKRLFYARVSFHNNEMAKQHGFRWNPDEKVWWRRMPPQDATELPFKTVDIGE